MNRGVNSDSLPIDLILEILSRLPVKSIVRFRCVSKLWESMLDRPYFRDLFLTKSLARPRLLFFIEEKDEWSLYSLPHHPQNPSEKSSLVLSADFCMKFPEDLCLKFRSFTSGLICISNSRTFKEREETVHVICNPSTGRFGILPKLGIAYNDPRSFLGFDPIGKQYKVLFMDYVDSNDRRILTLGHGKMRWREIQCPVAHSPFYKGICINGILYYLARQVGRLFDVLACFDVRFEKFKFIDKERFCNESAQLLNYKGKLGVFIHKNLYPLKMRLWVLEDVEKQEWSKYDYTLPEDKALDRLDTYNFLVAGVTSTGEIILSTGCRFKGAFYVFYFNPKRNTLRSVEIQGLGTNVEGYKGCFFFVDHVEDLKFDIMKTTDAPISISPPEQKRRRLKRTSTSSTFETSNKFDALCLLDDDDDDDE